MDTKSLPKATREERGIELARERLEEITRTKPFTWIVPSCTGSARYLVDLKRETCSCKDAIFGGSVCKHLHAARIVHAKTATCAGCGQRVRRRDLVEVLEEDHLSYFAGDRICTDCADRDGVLR